MWTRLILSGARAQTRRISTSFILHQRVTQLTVDPYCKIKIETSCPLIIKPLDLLDCPDANLLRITLSQDQDADIKLTDSREDGQQLIHIKDELIGQKILVEAPVKADFSIINRESVSLRDFQSDSIEVQSTGKIEATSIKGEVVKLSSSQGIECTGTLLAKDLRVQGDSNAPINLDKVLGDNAFIRSDKGNISIKSCYSEASSINTASGDLNLMNIHRNCTIDVQETSNVRMTGFHGTLLMTINAGSADIQCSELVGESVIVTHNPTDIDLKLSETVASSTYVHAAVEPEKLLLDSNLEPARGSKENGAPTLNMIGCPNKLFLQTKGKVVIKQVSWTETMAETLFGKSSPEGSSS